MNYIECISKSKFQSQIKHYDNVYLFKFVNVGFNKVNITSIIQRIFSLYIFIFTFIEYRYIFTIINQLVNYLHLLFGQNNFRYSLHSYLLLVINNLMAFHQTYLWSQGFVFSHFSMEMIQVGDDSLNDIWVFKSNI